LLPSAELLDNPTAKAERALLKRLEVINRFVQEQNGECSVVEALAFELRINPQIILQERQQIGVGYGQYAALRGVSRLGRGSIKRIIDDCQRGRSWSGVASNNGSQLSELMSWIDDVVRTTNQMGRQPRNQEFSGHR